MYAMLCRKLLRTMCSVFPCFTPCLMAVALSSSPDPAPPPPLLPPPPLFCRGSAICKIIGHNVLKSPLFQHEVSMWVFEEMVDGRKLSEIINTDHENVKYLPGIALPDNVVSSLTTHTSVCLHLNMRLCLCALILTSTHVHVVRM